MSISRIYPPTLIGTFIFMFVFTANVHHVYLNVPYNHTSIHLHFYLKVH